MENLSGEGTFEKIFSALFPGFFEREEIRALPDSSVFAELVLDLKKPLPWTAPLPFHEGMSFGLYEGPAEILQEAVHMGAAEGLHIGGPGCVGTLPAWRKKGIGLEMVRRATEIFAREGYDVSWIHWTHLEQWYQKLGYKTALRWNKDGFL